MANVKVVTKLLITATVISLIWYGLDFLAWFGLEFIFREMDIRPIYREATEAFRTGSATLTDHAVGQLIVSVVFVAIYQWMLNPKKLSISIIYGLLFGIVAKIDMGAITYTFHPISDPLMLIRIAVAAIEGLAAGLILAAIIKE